MSTSKLTINEQDQQVELVTNLFFDDFQDHLFKAYQINVEPLGADENKVIEHYLRQNMIIEIDGQSPLTLVIVSADLTEDNVLQVKYNAHASGLNNSSKLKITNTLLFDAFPKEQENILHLQLASSDETRMLHFSIQESMQEIAL